MDESAFLYIGVGATCAMFTLRMSFIAPAAEHKRFCAAAQKRVRCHIKNLGQDADEALAKAAAYSEQEGLPLRTTKEQLTDELRKISRATREERAESARREAEEDAYMQRIMLNRQLEKEHMLEQGIMPLGHYFMKRFETLPAIYLTWLVSARAAAESELFRKCGDFVAENLQHLLLRQDFFGEAGNRYELTLEVLKAVVFPTAFGAKQVTTLKDVDGRCFIVKSTAFMPEIGKVLRLKATVKGHECYRGQNQTVLERIKEL